MLPEIQTSGFKQLASLASSLVRATILASVTGGDSDLKYMAQPGRFAISSEVYSSLSSTVSGAFPEQAASANNCKK
jgi:hypothetical protein